MRERYVIDGDDVEVQVRRAGSSEWELFAVISRKRLAELVLDHINLRRRGW